MVWKAIKCIFVVISFALMLIGIDLSTAHPIKVIDEVEDGDLTIITTTHYYILSIFFGLSNWCFLLAVSIFHPWYKNCNTKTCLLYTSDAADE